MLLIVSKLSCRVNAHVTRIKNCLLQEKRTAFFCMETLATSVSASIYCSIVNP